MTYLPGFENPIGYIVGVRQWKFNKFLQSVTADCTWKPWEVVEGDIDEDSNIFLIKQGVYAAKEEHEELLQIPSYGYGIVTGKVALWGRIAEHTKGYRAQYAYPISLDHCTDRHVDMDRLREIYLNPPTETTKAIVEERLQWISERKKESERLHQSAYQWTHSAQTVQIGGGRQAGKSQTFQSAMDALSQKELDKIQQRMLDLTAQTAQTAKINYYTGRDDGRTQGTFGDWLFK